MELKIENLLYLQYNKTCYTVILVGITRKRELKRLRIRNISSMGVNKLSEK